jgi:hypothetical protein
MNEIVALATQALDDPDPWHGLVTLLDRWLQLHLRDPSLTQIFTNPALGQPRLDEARGRIAPLLNALADRAREQGKTRSDFHGTDVFFMQADVDRAGRPQPCPGPRPLPALPRHAPGRSPIRP